MPWADSTDGERTFGQIEAGAIAAANAYADVDAELWLGGGVS